MFRCILGGVTVELLSPLNDEKSPVDGYLKKVGAVPYHICYKVSDMDDALKNLRDIGFTQISLTAYSIPLDGEVCFLYSPDIGIIELIHRK